MSLGAGMEGAAPHIPVLLDESLEALQVRPDGVYLDATLGGGGHATDILKRLTGGLLVCFDRDPKAVENFQRSVSGKSNVVVARISFAEVRAFWEEHHLPPPDGILYDLGLSSPQLASGRGFSFHDSGALDMRYGPIEEGPTAADLVNTAGEEELARLFAAFDEPQARRLARRIVRARAERPITSAAGLIAILGMQKTSRRHPATRVFLALRVRVNRELEALRQSLPDGIALLNPGGRMAVITYHSAEDRIAKDIFRRAARGCRCELPPDECRCEFPPTIRLVTRRALVPAAREVESNPRARSAKLRVIERT